MQSVLRRSTSIRNSPIYRIWPLVASLESNSQKVIIRLSHQSDAGARTAVDSHTTEHEEHRYEENIKNRILEKALESVPRCGWSVAALSAGAEQAGYPGVAHGLFPGGAGDLVHYYCGKCNQQLVEQMETWPKDEVKQSGAPVKFLEDAVMARILMIEPYRSSWAKAMAIQALPHNAPRSLATLLALADDICHQAGDRSADVRWYVRRVGVAGLYQSAELFYLTDGSARGAATRALVAARLRSARLVLDALDHAPAPTVLSAAFLTAKNMLGISSLK